MTAEQLTEGQGLTVGELDRVEATLDRAYGAMAEAFGRLHSSARSSDTVIAARLGAARGQIEDVKRLLQARRAIEPPPPPVMGEDREAYRPLSPLRVDDNQQAWAVIVDLFQRHGLAAPPVRLRDELVNHLAWARYGSALSKSPARDGGVAEAELHDVLSELLEHSIARYGNPVHEGWGIGLVHANARRALAALKATNPIPKEPK